MIRLLTILLLSVATANAAIPIIFTRPGTNAVVVSTNCTQTFYTNAYAYWPMDALSTTTPDIISGRDLTATGNGGVTAGVISNAIVITEQVAAGADTLTIASDADFRSTTLAGNCGFSVRCWFKRDNASAIRTLVSREGDWSVTLNTSFRFLVATDAGATTVNSGINSTIGQWHYVVARYNVPSNQIGISVDDSEFVNANITGTLLSPTAADFTVNLNPTPGEIGNIDEVAIWAGHMFSTLDMITDYNSGEGTTYPFTATRILDPEGGHLADPEDGSLINDPAT